MLKFIYPIVYVLLVISPLMLIFLTGPLTNHGVVYEMGKAFALMGYIMLALQFLLASRQKMIEKHYGLDMIFKYHKAMAILAGMLILSHPILLSLGLGNFDMLTSLNLPWYIWLGKAVFIVILIQVLVSLFRKKFRIGFEKWRLSHNIFAGIILSGAFIHSMVTSHGDLQIGVLQYFWIGVFCAGLISYINHKFIKPARLKKKAYTISAVKQETHNVWTLEMTPPKESSRFDYYPGQFHFITLFRDSELPVEEHPFTISSSPTRAGVVTSTIKQVGDFTSTIGQTQKGDRVSIEAPFGRFSHVLHPDDHDLIFIAGGVGITPLMSMLRYMRDKRSYKNVLLLYANRTRADIVFQEELNSIISEEYPILKIVYILSQPDNNWSGEKGYLDNMKMSKYIADFSNKTFYLCCPPPMRKTVLSILNERQVKEDQIRVEIFSL